MDGGLYEHYPLFREYLRNAVTELIGTQIAESVVIKHSNDGSGIGAALLSSTHSIYLEESTCDVNPVIPAKRFLCVCYRIFSYVTSG